MGWRVSSAGSFGGASRGRRSKTRGALGASRSAVVVVVAALLVSLMPTTAAGETLPPAPDASATPEMGEYPESDFVQAAAELPIELVAAVERDLGLSPEQYLAQAEAASDASDLVEYLATEGIDASDRRLDGTTLTIGVESAAEAAVVEQSGAVAVIGEVAPAVPSIDEMVFEPAAEVYGGDAITWSSGSSGFRCSVGANGTNASGQPELVTAGHCTSSTLGNSGLYRHVSIGAPGFSPSGTSFNLGTPRAGSFQAGGGYDVGLLTVTQPGFTTGPTVTSYSGGQGSRTGGLMTVRDTIIPTTGSSICKSGSTTGWICGQILDDLQSNLQVGNCSIEPCYFVDAIVTDVCMLPGDSGGSAMVGSAFVGVNSASGFGRPLPSYTGTPAQFCAAATTKISAMAIMRHNPGVRTVESRYGTSWEPTVLVDSPTISLPTTYTSGATLTVSGGVTNVTPRTSIEVKVNGVSRTVVLDTLTGAWSATIPAVTGPSVVLTVQARWGQRSVAPVDRFVATDGGAFELRPLTIERIAGTDRYDVAIAIAQRAYPGPARPTTVYVVNGGDFPDALGAGSAAAATGGLVMLVPTDALPAKIRTELQRLGPQRVVIVGGPASVSETVRSSLVTALPSATVSRISGSSRFDVSLNVMNHIIATAGPRAFESSTNLYVANGFNYPDALVAGAAGSSTASFRGISPVLTVAGPESSLPAATRTAIENFGFTTIMVAGGPGSVSSGIESQLRSIVGTSNVARLGGATRFDAARSVSNDAYRSTADTVFLTTGFNFPDALAGAPLAGLMDAPMYSVETTCVPRGVLTDLDRLQPSRIILLGGTGTLTPAVAALTPCS